MTTREQIENRLNLILKNLHRLKTLKKSDDPYSNRQVALSIISYEQEADELTDMLIDGVE